MDGILNADEWHNNFVYEGIINAYDLIIINNE
jgi:hypothetical protein